MTRAELLAALAAATGPDREIDAQIALLIGVVPEGAFRPCAALDIGTFATGDRYWTCERYTGSLDAGRSLLAPGTLWAVGSMEEGPFARLVVPNAKGTYEGGYVQATAATAELALCIAALSARAP